MHVTVTAFSNPEIRDTHKGFLPSEASIFPSGMCHNCFLGKESKERDD